jgi:aldehyde:ferredoxin oxidoreductase
MTKPVKPIKFLEHIIHLMLIVPTGGVWLLVYLPRVFIKRIQIKNMSAEQNDAFEKLIDKTYFKKSTKDPLVPHVEMTYTKRIFASVAEAEDDPYYEFSEPYSFELVGESFYRDNLLSIIRKGNAFNEGELELDCIMQQEPNNEFDEFAVAVFAEGKKIGHVSKDYSYEVTTYLDELGVSGIRVKGVMGWATNNPTPPIGIRLDFNF